MAARLTTYLVVAIVACTLIAGLIVGAQREDSDGPVDLIVYNAVVYTADGSGDKAEAVAIRGNQILRVGSDREINRLRRPQTTVIDAHGAAVVPGFNDANVRFIEGGLGLDDIDLAGAATLDEIQARTTAWLQSHPDRVWVVGRGWDPAADLQPSRAALDAVVKDRPVLLLSADDEAAWVNTKALRLAGIARRTADPENGAIVRDPRTREATGLLRGAAVALVTRLLPAPTHAERARALRAAIAEAHRNGITSVQHVGASIADVQLYDEARRAGDLALRVYSALQVAVPQNDAELESLDPLASRFPDDPLFKTGAVTLDVDGEVPAQTAALLDPYAGLEAAGDTLVSADALNRAVRILDKHDWQVVARASGDRAVRMALDAFQHAARSNGASERARRHRVEGVALADARDIARFAPLGAIASLVPSAAAGPSWASLLGDDRAADLFPLADLTSARSRIAFGSGWPAAPLSPMEGIHAAVNRGSATESDAPERPRAAGMPLGAAIEAFTSGGAYASYDEQRKGSLEAGMLADIVVLSHDIFSTPPSRLRAAAVAVTIFDGKVVYRRDAKASN